MTSIFYRKTPDKVYGWRISAQACSIVLHRYSTPLEAYLTSLLTSVGPLAAATHTYSSSTKSPKKRGGGS